MSTELTLQKAPEAAALLASREQLAAIRAALAERESELAQVRAQLRAFEGRYLRHVGILYAELDELEAAIAEREVDLYDSSSARARAKEARERANETHQAAFSDAHDAPEFDPPPSLKTLFREVAKRIHPDFASDDAEQKHFTLLMVRANQAYTRGDTETLQRLLDDFREVNASNPGDPTAEGPAAELLRTARQIQHAQRDIAELNAEEQALHSSELGQLYLEADAAARNHRDLLNELAASLRDQIAEAQYRFHFVDRQVSGVRRQQVGS